MEKRRLDTAVAIFFIRRMQSVIIHVHETYITKSTILQFIYLAEKNV